MTQLLQRPDVVVVPPAPPRVPVVRDWTKGAWYGDPGLKVEVLDRMLRHRVLDEIAQGLYMGWYTKKDTDTNADVDECVGKLLPAGDFTQFRGCAVGCTLVDILTEKEIGALHVDGGWHERMAAEYGLTRDLCFAIDGAFEGIIEPREAADFAVNVIVAIPVGADLTDLLPIHNDHETQSLADTCPACHWRCAADDLLDRLAKVPLVARGR